MGDWLGICLIQALYWDRRNGELGTNLDQQTTILVSCHLLKIRLLVIIFLLAKL